MAEYFSEAYWILKQLHNYKSNPEWCINFRCIHNVKPYKTEEGKIEKRTVTTLNEVIEIKNFKTRWLAGLEAQLHELNQSSSRPSNIYFAINPLLPAKRKMEKESFAGYGSLYLDLDDNKSYTKEQRWAQIWYWTQMGFEPSFVIDSGHGYHVYWLLTKLVNWKEYEQVLKRMVLLSGCRDKGNTFDVTRVFRLPGFLNVKEWYNNDTPPCAIVWPQNWRERERCLEYEPEHFLSFPPSEISNLQQYYQEAQRRSADNPGALQHTLAEIVKAAADAAKRAELQQTGEKLFGQQTSQANAAFALPAAPTNTPFEPSLNLVPQVDDIKWPSKNGKWMKKFCKAGYSGMTQGELDELKIKLNMQDVSCSALDFKIINHLVKGGYTKEAVREFWTRTDVKLHRLDKESKNANYFDMTYTKALDFVRSAIEQHSNGDGSNGKADLRISVTTDCRTIVTGKDWSEDVLTGEIRLNAIYVDKDALTPNDKEWFDCTVISQDATAENGIFTANLLIPNKAFTSVATLKEYSHDLFRVVTNNNAHMQRLAHWLMTTYRNAPRHFFHSNIIYKGGKFIFPQYTISKDGVEHQTSLPQVEMMTKKYPLYAAFLDQSFKHEKIIAQLRENWSRVLQMHLPRVVASTIGLITANGIRPKIEQETTYNKFHLPTLNIRGAGHTAKTETVAYLCTIMGVRREKFIVSTSTSSFALTRMLSSTNFLPIIIDEFKDEDDPNVRRQMDSIRQIVRRIYSGETIFKGKSDLSYTGIEVHGCFFVIGEASLEREGNVAEFTRILPIETDEFEPAKHIANYTAIEHLSWHELCPLLYQFLAGQNAEEMLTMFIELRNEVVLLLSNSFGNEKLRVSHNLAAVWFGCRLFDRFLASIDPTLPTIEQTLNPRETLIKYVSTKSVEEGQSLVLDTPTPTGVTKKVFANNELWSTVKLYGELLTRRHEIIQNKIRNGAFLFKEYTDGGDKNELYLHFETLYDVIVEYHQKMKDNVFIVLKKLRDLAHASVTKNEKLVIRTKHSCRTPHGFKKTYVFDSKKLRDLGIWPDRETMQLLENSFTNQLESAEDTPPNRNAQGGAQENSLL